MTKRFLVFSTVLKRFEAFLMRFVTLGNGEIFFNKILLKKASKFREKTAEDGKNFRPHTPRLVIDLYNRCTQFDKKKRPSFKDVIKFFIELERKKIKFSI